MLILSLRTDNPQAEIGLFDDKKELTYLKWQAHRQLAETIHKQVEALLERQGKLWHDIEGIVAFQGPGSFTGLRIGLSVANALAYSLQVPIVGSEGGKWLNSGIAQLLTGNDEKQVMPEYGSDPHITQQKK